MTVIADFLSRCGLFRGFDAAQLTTLSSAAGEIGFDAGTDIVREGESGDAMYVVMSGAVQVYTRDATGRQIVLARLEAGEHFGEQALLPGGTGRRNASVRAAEAVRVARVEKAAFQSALSHDDVLRERLVDIGAEQIRSNLQQLSPLARGIGLNNASTLRRELAAGEVLFNEGDEADALYFVSSGRLGVYRGPTLITYVERGACVGELALVRKDRRSATVTCVEPAVVIAVPRAAFDDAYRESETVRSHVATLQRVYELPQRGIVTQHAGVFAGHECITTLYHLEDNRVFAAYRVIGQPLYAVERIGGVVAETLAWRKDGGQFRELSLDSDGNIIGLTAHGEYADAHRFHLLVLEGKHVTSDDRQQFARSGTFEIAIAPPAADVVCHCVHLTSERLRTAINAGAVTFTALQQATGCGSVCGGCIPVVAEMLGSEEWLLADVVAESDEAPNIRSFELAARGSAAQPPYPNAKPGQHVVVEGMVGGLRVRRPYTLSSAAEHRGRLVITVKREDHGTFSRWLFEQRKKDEPVRITRPRGEYVVDFSEGAAVCIVAGIGVTPAIAAVRTLLAGRQPGAVYVHYSGRVRNQMAFVREFESVTQPEIEVVVKETSREGRISKEEIAAIAARFPGAHWYLCGPQPFLDDVARFARSAGVGDSRIHVETFISIGAPGSTAEERVASSRYLLVPPQRSVVLKHVRILKGIGRAVVGIANSGLTDWRLLSVQLNPFRWLEQRVCRMARIDPALPVEHVAIVSALSWGPYGYQGKAFARLDRLRQINRERARVARDKGKPLPANTPDGDTFVYWIPGAPFPKFPKSCAVETGWTSAGAGKILPAYVTRSRRAIEHVLINTELSDRGAIPYHFVQQVLGRSDLAADCPGRKPGGIFAGQVHDNATWVEDRKITVDMFGFSGINEFGPTMVLAAGEVSGIIDEALARDPDMVIDLDVLMSKVAYTIIVRSIFGNVDLAEMHTLGRDLSESLRDGLDFAFQFSMGRQDVPQEYVDAMLACRGIIRKITDLLRHLDREGKLTEVQRRSPVVRLVLDTAEEPNGAYDRLFALVLPLIIGGHETTGHTLSWAFYELARDPQLAESVFREIQHFRAAHAGRNVTTEDYDERPLSWALLAEVLRRHSAIQALPRTTSSDGVIPADPETGIGEFRYPVGTMFVTSIVAIHLDPARWVDPLTFRVDRWMDGIQHGTSVLEQGRIVRSNIRAREKSFDWIPFYDGPTRCPGQYFNAHEFLLILDTLVPRYRFELVSSEEVPDSQNLIVGPETGRLAVRIRRRNGQGGAE